LLHRVRSQALVEFAAVLMLFLTLLFGIFDFGVVLSDWVSATSAASAGARQAAVGACFAGSASTPAICPGPNETSVIGAVIQSAPVLAADGNCQNPPQPAAAYQCLTHLDVAVIDTNVQHAACQDTELWVSSQTARSGSTSSVLQTSGTSWGANALVGSQIVFTSGANDNTSRTVTANTASTITVGTSFPSAPSPGDTFDVTTLTLVPITSGWLTCSATPLSPAMNDTLTIVVRAQVDVPVPLPPLPTSMLVESSSTVRYEGAFVP
jgi:hypothetical protein